LVINSPGATLGGVSQPRVKLSDRHYHIPHKISNITSMKRLPLWLLLLFCISCTVKPPEASIKIVLVDSNNSIKITGLNSLIIQDIARDTSNHFESLVPVYKMPIDTDLKNYQPIQPGKYLVKDSALIFTPDTVFTKHQTYFVRYYRYGDDNSIWAFIKGKKYPGKIPYTDLIFKQ
jgi:hypothetical protein